MASVAAVRTTGLYCRPDCGGKPLAQDVTAYPLPAAAEAAGYRACRECRPYRTPQTLSWDAPELVCRGVQLILDGLLDRGSEVDLGKRLGVSARHLRRLFVAHLGVTPDALARSARTHFARTLLDDTDLSISQVAIASGFGSLRQFNRACREIFHASPSELRALRRESDRLVADGGLLIRLPLDGRLDWPELGRRLAATAVPGVEVVADGVFRRTIEIRGEPAVIEVFERYGELLLRVHASHWEELIHLVQRLRRLLSLDAAGGAWDPLEAGVREIVGGRDALHRLVELFGEPVDGLAPLGLTHAFPTAAVLANADLTAAGLAPPVAAAVRAFAAAAEPS